jgi:hypothetical protein
MISYGVWKIDLTLESGETIELPLSLPETLSRQDIDRLSVALKTEIERRRIARTPTKPADHNRPLFLASNAAAYSNPDAAYWLATPRPLASSGVDMKRLDMAIQLFAQTGNTDYMAEALDSIRALLRTITQHLEENR